MKYQNLQAFEKHLQEAFPAHLAHAYMIISPDRTERRRIADKIVSLIVKQGGERRLFSCEGGFSQAIELASTQPLFQPSWAVLLEDVDCLKKEEIAALAAQVARPSSFTYWILTGAEAPDFYAQVKKELILLDMSGEKPWEKKGRLKEWLIAEAAREKKVLTEDAALLLLEQVGAERAALEQELFKLITYGYEKKQLTAQDVRKIAAGAQPQTLWKLAEKLVWEEESLPRQPPEDISALLAFIAQARIHLDSGLRGSFAPKYAAAFKKRGRAFFPRALNLLFEVELQAKSLSLSVDLLWDLLISKITHFKHATALSKSSR